MSTAHGPVSGQITTSRGPQGRRSLVAWALRSFALGALCLAVLPGCPEDKVRKTLPEGARIDTFHQVDVGKVDVLFVVDNSGSMAQEQENVGRNFGRFFESLQKARVDYHIGVTTTDTEHDQGRLRGSPAVITPKTPDPLGTFARNVKVGIQGSARERGLDAARLTCTLKPTDFWRDDAFLFLVFVTDEEDKSEPGVPKFYYRFFEGLKNKGNEAMVSAGAIIGDVPGGCTSENGSANPGTRYKAVVDLVGGRIGSICDAEFGDILRQMGVDAVGLKRKFPLTVNPDVSTVQITVHYPCDADKELLGAVCSKQEAACGGSGGEILCTVKQQPAGQPEADGWTYEPGSVSLLFHGQAVPPKGSAIDVQYFEQGKAPVTP